MSMLRCLLACVGILGMLVGAVLICLCDLLAEIAGWPGQALAWLLPESAEIADRWSQEDRL